MKFNVNKFGSNQSKCGTLYISTSNINIDEDINYIDELDMMSSSAYIFNIKWKWDDVRFLIESINYLLNSSQKQELKSILSIL